MSRWAFTLVLLAGLWAVPATAEPFRLFGASFGMTAEELGAHWTPLDSGDYYIENSLLFDIRPAFDPRGKMYKLTFSFPLVGEHPLPLAYAAAQNLLQRTWGGRKDLALSVKTGGDSVQVTLVDQVLRREFITAIETQLAPLLKR